MRSLVPVLGLLCACTTGPAPGRGASEASVAAKPPAIAVRAVGCVGMTVSDLERAARFYTDVLTFHRAGEQVVQDDGTPFRRARLELGSECLELSEPLAGPRRPVPPDSRSNDRWFQHVAIVVRDMAAAYARLEAGHVPHVSASPQTLPAWNKNASGIRAYYFKDPDSHTLEVIWFPPDKGQARWHAAPGDALFLGIDHTAIASGDTAASLAFYVDRLGLRVAGGSENYGTEQEQLNAVPGAHLRITTLRAAAGPGVELLEYLAPKDGRPMPADERPDDLVHWRTTMVADGLDAPRTLRDPDGHVMEMHPR